MLSAARSRTALLALTGASFVALLAGCSSTSGSTQGAGSSGSSGDSSSSGSASSPSSSASSSATDAGSSSGSGTYKNGTFSSNGSYSSPGGQETINVSLTIADDSVKAVTVKTVKADPTAQQYEQQFIGGISSAIVGKKIDDLNVTNVAGSSLTSQGFNAALTKIKAAAKDA
ncbi:hypothetical protein [Frondihabitans australicus]|uniref:FMN-binding protein n=1 Tax=Frondihabitans australicus TaxID=386892 RepID=A0A495IKV7_9MICO|nr:hypothetical protein [Frondihabitans australicus]RKR76563.1 hypothetical protein C8E83_3740 [Frondihabitans australicus]